MRFKKAQALKVIVVAIIVLIILGVIVYVVFGPGFKQVVTEFFNRTESVTEKAIEQGI